ncbi:hypothetical protein [Metabacillus endolithicus]|uniref:N-acetyltransferase domain-containing protein n=1 Tax=Metabacillus endolithicus TaxID=1535204 RepID=A0ABW5C316_9BACI|nr:hypothetical protein [Metabacillus endolithicus]UPG61657.1 hypothetical protein MVE64_13160 [Metabacillus endolithicus]
MNDVLTVQKELIDEYEGHLNRLTERLGFRYSISPDQNLIEIWGETLNEPRFKMFTINVFGPDETVGELTMTELFVPKELHYNRIVFGLMNITYEIAKKYDYDVFITNMVSSFYHYMTKVRGALPIEVENTVQLVDSTNLN